MFGFSFPLAWAAVRAFAAKVPVWVWIAAAVLIVGLIERNAFGDRRYEAGRESVLAPLREAKAKAVTESLKRVEAGNKAGAIRAEKEAAVIAEQIDAIEKAEAAGENPLDVLF